INRQGKRLARVEEQLRKLAAVRGRRISNHRAQRLAQATYNNLAKPLADNVFTSDLLGMLASTLESSIPTTVLITGGLGFIGSQLANYILETHPSHIVVLYDVAHFDPEIARLADLKEQDKERLFIYQGDVRDKQKVKQVFAAADVVVNCAEIG